MNLTAFYSLVWKCPLVDRSRVVSIITTIGNKSGLGVNRPSTWGYSLGKPAKMPLVTPPAFPLTFLLPSKWVMTQSLRGKYRCFKFMLSCCPISGLQKKLPETYGSTWFFNLSAISHWPSPTASHYSPFLFPLTGCSILNLAESYISSPLPTRNFTFEFELEEMTQMNTHYKLCGQ